MQINCAFCKEVLSFVRPEMLIRLKHLLFIELKTDELAKVALEFLNQNKQKIMTTVLETMPRTERSLDSNAIKLNIFQIPTRDILKTFKNLFEKGTMLITLLNVLRCLMSQFP